MAVTSKEIKEIIKECRDLPYSVANKQYKNGSYSSSTGYLVDKTCSSMVKKLEKIYDAIYEMEMREKILSEMNMDLQMRLSVSVR